MSSGLECEIVGLADGRWFYMLQSPSCPKCAWDWREEDPSVGGPFKSEQAAFDGLRAKHQNPGGYTTIELSVEEAISDGIMKDNIELALGRELKFPPFPDQPVDVAYHLIEDRHAMSDGITTKTHKRPGIVRVNHMSKMGDDATVLGMMEIVAMRDASGIDVTIESDPETPDEVTLLISQEVKARAAKIYPGEMISITLTTPPEQEFSSMSF